MLAMTPETEATTGPADPAELPTPPEPERPELDPEAVLLCALLHTGDVDEVSVITTHLQADDFQHPVYGDLYGVIADLATAGEGHGPSRVLSALTDAGRLAGHAGQRLTDTLQTVMLLGTPVIGLRTLAHDVARAAYRRRFTATASALTHAAEHAPTGDLLGILLEHGRAMRSETNRLNALVGTQHDSHSN